MNDYTFNLSYNGTLKTFDLKATKWKGAERVEMKTYKVSELDDAFQVITLLLYINDHATPENKPTGTEVLS